MIKELENLPEVSFIEGITLESVQQKMLSDFQEKYTELTGKTATLTRADSVTLVLYACAVQIFQMYEVIDIVGKQSMLKYAYGPYLENLAALKGIIRKTAVPAKVTMRFTLSDVRPDAVGIPAGIRVSPGNGSNIYFSVDNYTEIPIGSLYADVECTCVDAGSSGNGLPAGLIKTLVDPVPYIDNVTNIDESYGGSDIESDEDLAERVFRSPTGYSVAGPEDAYVTLVKDFSTNVGDVVATSPSPTNVSVIFTMADGSIPTQQTIDDVAEYLRDGNIRPLTDNVMVSAPETESYDINVAYYINQSESGEAVSIRAAVEAAVDEYVSWQNGAIGRDLSPSMLIRYMMDAGAKRVEVTSPVHTVVGSSKIAELGTRTVTYGGLEDD